MVLSLTEPQSLVAVAQIIVAIVTLVYAFDVLVLHRQYNHLGNILTQNVGAFTAGIFVTVLSFVIDSFDQADLIATIGEIIGIFLIGIYFRSCVHNFIGNTSGGFINSILRSK